MARPRMGNVSRRMAWTLLAIAIVVLLFVGRLVSIQILQAAAYNKQAEGQRGKSQSIEAFRGDILDDHGVVLAQTIKRYQITTDQRNVSDIHTTAKDGKTEVVTVAQASEQLAQILGTTPAAIELALVGSGKKKAYSVVAQNVDASRYQKVRALNLPWLYFSVSPQRFYPNGKDAGNLIGFTNTSMVGQQGIEAMQNKCLQGKNGHETFDLGSNGVSIPGSVVVEKPVQDGGTVKTTINRDLQWYAEQQIAQRVKHLSAKWGAVIVMDVKTGALRAVAETPTVDPNNVGASSPDNWGSRSFSSPFEPGSTMKSVTVAGGIQTGAFTPLTQVTAPYSRNVGDGIEFSDAFQHGAMKLTTTGVLRYSSNTGVSRLGDMYPTSVRYDFMRKFGFGHKTTVGFTGESAGLLRNYKNWDKATKYTTMFGQGLSATFIQIAGLYQTIANDGVKVEPKLVNSCTDAAGKTTQVKQGKPITVLSKQTAVDMRRMLMSVVTEGTATAAQVPGYQVAGKTGTAQIAKDGGGGYAEGSYATSFVGMAPAANPRFVVAVMVYDPKADKHSTNSTDVFSNVMTQVLKHYKVAPTDQKLDSYKTFWGDK